MATKTFDSKSYDLATHFLSDEPKLDTNDNRAELASAIQGVIELWFFEKKAASMSSTELRKLITGGR